ncbi:hypothetical protein PoB_003053000 [Plakobranchus ocellatus]|uniref:Uncharacterized protein n=1 Tax=Plakobranchus ocellatus TaxID=259542 RepID=A0AAV4A9I5_9GAST|nr:hypothetical protein PoB_003053000 [Plakobranchus ocellatus]
MSVPDKVPDDDDFTFFRANVWEIAFKRAARKITTTTTTTTTITTTTITTTSTTARASRFFCNIANCYSGNNKCYYRIDKNNIPGSSIRNTEFGQDSNDKTV